MVNSLLNDPYVLYVHRLTNQPIIGDCLIRSRLTANGNGRCLPASIEAALREENTGTAVLAVLRAAHGDIARDDLVTATRDYLLAQMHPDYPADPPTLPSDDDIAITLIRLVELGVAELVVTWPCPDNPGQHRMVILR